MRRAALAAGIALVVAGPGRAAALVVTLDPEALSGEAPAGRAAGGAAPAPAAASPSSAAASSPAEAPLQASVTTSATRVSPGESFFVDVVVLAPPGTSVMFPAELATDGAELRAVDAGPAPPPSGSTPRAPAQRYQAAVFVLTEAKVPPLSLKYRLPDGREGTLTTEAVPVEVVSSLPNDADPQKIADVKGPLSLDIGRAFWVALGLGLVAVAALVAWGVRRKRPGDAVEAPVPPLPPAEEARAALDALDASGLLGRGDHRGFYIALTAIAKRYLERRLKAPVLEMTTAEMVAFLRDTPPAAALVGPARDLAGAADQVKFARGQGLTAEAERHTQAVLGMIATLEAALAPPPPAPAQEKVA